MGIYIQFVLFFIFSSEALRAESGFGVIPDDLKPGPLSVEQRNKLNTCYVRITPTALAEQTKCLLNKFELDCKKFESCKWQSTKRACWGVGLKQCHSVLLSLCSKIIEVPEFPSKEDALRRYECDPNATDRIIRTTKDE